MSWYWQSKEEMSKKRLPELEYLDAHTIEHLIDTLIVGRHAERNRAILKRSLIDGICFEPLAEEFNLSVRQVKNIVYKCEDKIFRC